MAPAAGGKTRLLLLSMLSLLVLAHARLVLDRSDLDALKTIRKDMGIDIQLHLASTKPCNLPGVICERRLTSNNTYVLRITRLIFKSQQLKGSLSPAIGQLSELKELSLSNNKLVDQLPSQIVNCTKLEILNLRNNRFSGNIPSELSSLVRLRVLDVGSNKFTGDLSFLKYFPNLEKLSLSDNLFTGKIPASIRSFRNLRSFDVSGNLFLEGPVPSLNRVEPSNDNLPRRYIFVESPGMRSNGSAAAPASRQASNTAPAPSPSEMKPHKGHNGQRKLSGWLLGFLAGATAGMVSGFVFSLLFRLALAAIRGGRRDSGPAIFSPLIKKAEDLAFLESEEGLSSLEIIGRGGCGEVYKAELPGSNGKMIAIKKILQPPRDATELTEEDTRDLDRKMRQIRSEIQTVGQIRHRNLLPLLAHLTRSDCHLLVYEYMKNGSLQDLLQKVSQGLTELDWLTRYRIAVGVAAGLEYLHMNHTPRIIHRDLKPANVLLDDDMEARISDFGLAKAMPDNDTHVTSSNVVGTLGYIAPEYHLTSKFTEKSDIYSFGVLLAALVIGKLPSDEFFQHTQEISLVKWLRNVMASDKPQQAIDQKLIGNGFEEQMLLVLKVANFCTRDDPKNRPNSKDVRCMLSQIKH
ncbi:leucine-rich repeat receptor-like serine/threonine/tyrosine-protein kinase SOBIR1 [Rhodamnia argentea]|uniref:Leucine-rich repeat receptor-like serine/threonine/tyrosine-protein kinase SOBIR1 n=1 Tax=Rhodamnia argentea TaxID=178133 RepID=A0A8B8Q4X8_9MYRT|nr:leucine-rich repeat receptor-like serine/threonine/tyrosine-protein kinase SOBIR1 [Rhodamnia argentea]